MEEKIMNVATEMAPAAVEAVSKGMSRVTAYVLGVATGAVGMLGATTICGMIKNYNQKKLNEAEVAQIESTEEVFDEVN